MIRRPPRSTLDRSSAASDLYKRQGTYWIPTQYQLNDDVSIVKGSHQLAFGLGAVHGRVNQRANFLSGGSFTFNGSVTGLGMGDFMLGRVFTFQQGTPNKLEIHEK